MRKVTTLVLEEPWKVKSQGNSEKSSIARILGAPGKVIFDLIPRTSHYRKAIADEVFG